VSASAVPVARKARITQASGPKAPRTRTAKHSKAVVEEHLGVPPVVSQPVAKKTVTQEEIAKRAYSYWVSRGYQGGNPYEDWLRAESELKSSAA
jgi:hypothetical protein